MLNSLKKNFSFLILKRGIVLFLCLSVLLGVFWPAHAQAGLVDRMVGAITAIPTVIATLFLTVVVALSYGLSWFAGFMLKGVLSPLFIEWSYTNPATNPLIDVGLKITQPFANMILVLVLVFIGLTTILRLGGYETKKLLPTFILVALLVNFVPVIAGLVVDPANITMNLFIGGITGMESFRAQREVVWNGLYTQITDIGFNKFSYKEQVRIVASLFVLALVNFGTFLLLLLFIILFLVRYVAIWTLVILGPLAFVFYILPATRSFAQQWWNQLIQWSFIGVTMAFFLYLAEQLVVNYAVNPAAIPVGDFAFGTSIVAMWVPLVFLGLAFTLGLSTSAMGAKEIIGGATKAGKWTGKWVGKKAGKGIGRWVEEKAGLREKVGGAVKRWENIPYLRAFIPETARRYATPRAAVEEGMKDLNLYSSEDLGRRIDIGELYGPRAVAAMMILTQRKDTQAYFQSAIERHRQKIDEIKQQAQAQGRILTDEQALTQIPEFTNKLTRHLQIVKQAGYRPDILRTTPRFARMAPAAGIKGLEGLGPDEAVTKIVREASNENVFNWEAEEYQDPVVVKALMERSRDIWEKVGQRKKDNQINALKTINQMLTKFAGEKNLSFETPEQRRKVWDKYAEENPSVKPFHTYTTGEIKRAAGMGWADEKGALVIPEAERPPEGPTPGEAARIIIPPGAQFQKKSPRKGPTEEAGDTGETTERG